MVAFGHTHSRRSLASADRPRRAPAAHGLGPAHGLGRAAPPRATHGDHAFNSARVPRVSASPPQRHSVTGPASVVGRPSSSTWRRGASSAGGTKPNARRGEFCWSMGAGVRDAWGRAAQSRCARHGAPPARRTYPRRTFSWQHAARAGPGVDGREFSSLASASCMLRLPVSTACACVAGCHFTCSSKSTRAVTPAAIKRRNYIRDESCHRSSLVEANA